MTTTVTVKAHCANTKEVVASIVNTATGEVKEEFTLQDGESRDCVVYDDLQVSVKEVLK